MSAGETGAIGPVSVRYAAQIRELLQAQALQRIAAAEEAARASSEARRAAKAKPPEKVESAAEAKPAPTTTDKAVIAAPEQAAHADAVEPTHPGKLVDVQA